MADEKKPGDDTVAPVMKAIDVEMPATVTAIVRAAGGERNMPMAMAMIVGAIPHIAIALFNALPRAEYLAFADNVTKNLNTAKEIANAENPQHAFNAEVIRLSRPN